MNVNELQGTIMNFNELRSQSVCSAVTVLSYRYEYVASKLIYYTLFNFNTFHHLILLQC